MLPDSPGRATSPLVRSKWMIVCQLNLDDILISNQKGERDGPRPRLCHMKKGSGGYGFNLHSEKNKPGQFIRAVDDDSPAQRAGLRPQDKIIQVCLALVVREFYRVNGVSVIGMQHTEVVAAIKAKGDETTLLVVDAEAEEFFKKCNVQPGEEHVTGLLPEPVSERGSDEEVSSQLKSKLSVSSQASSASSNASQPAADRSSTPPQVEFAGNLQGSAGISTPERALSINPCAQGERTPDPEPSPSGDAMGLNISLAQAKERAHQKRAAKKAPPMDWSKRNELFSNL
ncbi:hypothetical protein CCH79_00003415 [Gambusia affinis]|uniref:Na(+)/H(+) exchange regulatory cofactor NHE-RF1 n=1 Tax=Gambusia affinis TaxID=33528 RepID=A0A315VDR3_GAMAF|nr:hypothetical protein CCH79_00003415 [Gambusia affinis]